jgi:phosphoserine phosphatase
LQTKKRQTEEKLKAKKKLNKKYNLTHRLKTVSDFIHNIRLMILVGTVVCLNASQT